MDLGLTGKRALVTGSTVGIGLAAARAGASTAAWCGRSCEDLRSFAGGAAITMVI
jgi:NAD(P)-dependent dehydrogenase (short-subunit alcohol dehydrogenase family)